MHGANKFGLASLTNLDQLAADRRGADHHAAQDREGLGQSAPRAGAGRGLSGRLDVRRQGQHPGGNLGEDERCFVARLTGGLGLASTGAALAEPASPDEVMAAIATFYPGVACAGPVRVNADLSATPSPGGSTANGTAPTILGSVDPEKVETLCNRSPIHISTAPDEIALVQESKPAPVTYRYTYVGGSLFSEWVDTPALFARLGFDKMPDDEKRRQLELNVLSHNGGFVVIVRASENVLWMYSLAGGARLYARCG